MEALASFIACASISIVTVSIGVLIQINTAQPHPHTMGFRLAAGFEDHESGQGAGGGRWA